MTNIFLLYRRSMNKTINDNFIILTLFKGKIIIIGLEVIFF